jgi:cytochrome P450 family 6
MALLCSNVFFDISILLVIFLGVAYAYFRRKYSYWDKKGVHNSPATIPFGSMKGTALKTVQIGIEFCKIYSVTKHLPYAGFYFIHRPIFMVNDLHLIKNILTRDFAHFTDHGMYFIEEIEPLMGHLFNLEGAKWRNLRAKLTPTFTSNKMKKMFDILADCATEMSDYLEKQSSGEKVDDVKEVLGKFGNDVIASCAFGIECKSFKNPDEKFRKMGRRIFTPTLWEEITISMSFLLPELGKKLKMRLFEKDIEDFFMGVVKETVKYREENGVVKNDFMQLLIQLKNDGQVADDQETDKGISYWD